MNAEIKNNELIIRIPIEGAPRPSRSGKTLVVASSSGNRPTEAEVNGKPLIVGVNAYIRR